MQEYRSHFADTMVGVTKQISTAGGYFHELDLGQVFALPPAAVAVAERLTSYCRVDPNSDRVLRVRLDSLFDKGIDTSGISNDQIRLCSKLLGPYRLLPSTRSETSGESQVGLVVSEPYNDHEGWKWIVMINSGDLFVLNIGHRDAHKVLQAPSEIEIFSHWKVIDLALQEENLKEPIRLASEASRYTNWQQMLDTVPPLFPSEKAK